MREADLLALESGVTAIEEAVAAVRGEVDRDRLPDSALARLSVVEAELSRSRVALEKVMKEHGG